MHSRIAFGSLLLGSTLFACRGGGGGGQVADSGTTGVLASRLGLAKIASTLGAGESIAALKSAIEGNAMVALALTVDHQLNATRAQPTPLALPPSTVFVFGNPNLGTALLAENPFTSLESPLKMLAYDDGQGGIFVSFDSPAYLQARHGLSTVNAQLTMAQNALARFASAATGTTVARVLVTQRIWRAIRV